MMVGQQESVEGRCPVRLSVPETTHKNTTHKTAREVISTPPDRAQSKNIFS